MAKNLVIVESPAKAKTLKKFLGNNYKIQASVGHVRDLPKSSLGIDIENDFEPKYITIRGKGEVISKLRQEVKTADKVYLATDPDREGEAISWHLKQLLNLDSEKTYRISFNEITKTAVKNAIKQAHDINMNLVDSQQARRVLDRIVGYKISPILWKKVKRGLSAGRVQSVALRIICDRESEIKNFIPEEYWTIEASLESEKIKFVAKFYGLEGKKIELKTNDDVAKIFEQIKNHDFVVDKVKTGNRNKNPMPPFTTSTMQQEAAKILGFSTNKTMRVAQQLYEGVSTSAEGTIGLISYIRTDSIRISDEAFSQVTKYILENYGEKYCNNKKLSYKSKGKTQDAHEAIRPTNAFRNPDDLKDSLTSEQYKLYKLIWERFVASQMTPAIYDTLSVQILCNGCEFRTSGSTLKFDGYLKVYKKNEIDQVKNINLPNLMPKQKLKLLKLSDEQHFTQPPPKYTEASLVKILEELGIGRPSTYATIISNIQNRGYVVKENKNFHPTELGEIINEIMKNNFYDIVNVDFTAKMESELDKIEEGNMYWKDIIRNFYDPFNKTLLVAEEKINKIKIEDEKTDIICEKCGKPMVIKLGRYGKFMACSGFPECRNTKPLLKKINVECPLCKSQIVIKKTKKGRNYFGCENLDCSFMTWNKPTGELCPKCGSPMVEKGTKNLKITCSKCAYVKN